MDRHFYSFSRSVSLIRLWRGAGRRTSRRAAEMARTRATFERLAARTMEESPRHVPIFREFLTRLRRAIAAGEREGRVSVLRLGMLDEGPASGHVEGSRIVLHAGLLGDQLALVVVHRRRKCSSYKAGCAARTLAALKLLTVVLWLAVELVHPVVVRVP